MIRRGLTGANRVFSAAACLGAQRGRKRRSSGAAEPRRTGIWITLAAACAVGGAVGGAVACTPAAAPSAAAAAGPKVTAAPELTAEQQLDKADAASAGGRYAEALSAYEKAVQVVSTRARAELGRRKVQLETGQYQAAAQPARFAEGNAAMAAETAVLQARALLAMGQAAAALERLTGTETPAARLLQAEVLLSQGKREAAHPLLMSLIEDYNEERITESDSDGMSYVGRAAHLLRSPEDANEAFNAAERASPEPSFQALLWRVELFVEHHDLGHAEEVLLDLLERNPHHPRALVWLGRVKLEQALDFDEARRLAEEALTINPQLTTARAVLAGIALRDMQIERAEEQISKGLSVDAADLELLSLRGAARFLADDPAGFEKTRDEVLRHNPQYARFFTTVGVYAEWEHRYDEIVRLMNQALVIDPLDPAVNAQLGLNSIRNGDETAGLMALRTAFSLDPYNVRVFNTLNLYEKTIAQNYTSVAGSRFNFRYPTEEKPVLERFVPKLLDKAWEHMTEAYQFEPSTPVGIELYAERESFAVRTSGLPQSAIQGVCFGKTLASMSPYYEKFNVGMTLWHELAHVFHIQLSANHVPRWFTEGLAEYETLVARPEWRREQDTDLYLAFSSGRLPKVSAMNEAFTRAEDIGDIAVAYYASTQIVHMLVEQYGYSKVREMLVAWGKGKRTADVFRSALGVELEKVDRDFDAFLRQRLARYDGQFVPSQRIGNPERVQQEARKNRKDPDALSRFALLLMQNRDYDAAARVLEDVRRVAPKHAVGLWLSARLALRKGDGKTAKTYVDGLLAQGKDGYETQLLLSRAAEMLHDDATTEKALTRAHEYDPSQSEVLYGLLDLWRRKKDATRERQVLEKLAGLEEHSGTVFRSLVRTLLETPDAPVDHAIEMGQSAIYADMYDPASHVAYALALERAGNGVAATEAFEVALLAPGSEGERIKAYQEFAEYSARHGQTAKAKSLRAKSQELERSAAEEAED